MRCPNCRKEISDTAKVCGHCGHRLAGGPATAPTARRGVPGWAWGAGGGLFGVGLAAALFLSGVIASPSGREPTSAPPPQAVALQPTSTVDVEPTAADAPAPSPTPSPSPSPSPSPTPTASRIVFSVNRGGAGGMEIYAMDADGRNEVRLTDNQRNDSQPAWSPDGSRIALVSALADGDTLHVMDADGQWVDKLVMGTSPAWSADGSRIAFQSFDGDSEIFVMDADGGNVARLTENGGGGGYAPGVDWDGEPAWSPDGGRIAFQSNRDGNFNVFVMDAGGGNPINLTDYDGADGDPDWSPDGSRIAFQSDRDGTYHIFVMDADGRNVNRLTGEGGCYRPAWSPDGSRIAFVSYRDGQWGIYVMDADGGNVIPLTAQEDGEFDLDW